MARCFVGIMLPDDIKDRVEEVQRTVLKTGIDCKLVERENLHISLSFLGEVGDMQAVADKMKGSMAGIKRFSIDVKNVLLIPNQNFTRVVALGASDERGFLESLRLRVKDCAGGDSHKAHVTLCRVRDIADKRHFLGQIKPLMDYEAGSFEAQSVQLIKSELSGEGPFYSVVESFPLE